MLLFWLKRRLGIFYERARTNPNPTPVEVNLHAIRECVILTLTEVIKHAIGDHRRREYEDLPATLSNGIVVLTYCKLSTANSFHRATCTRFLKIPIVPDLFEVPEPYALAISQLGKFKVSGLRDELILLPTIPAAQSPRFGLPTDIHWNQANYCQAVDRAKKLGLRFTTVDLTVKMGSSWWLLNPVEELDYYELRCLIPEENFTVETAILRDLFSVNADGGYQADIVDLTPLGNDNFGSMSRNPPERVDVSTYYAVCLSPVKST